jgi:hypothetical protein
MGQEESVPNDVEQAASPKLHVTRRGVLVGTATAAFATAANAFDYPVVDVDYEDASRRALLITFDLQPLALSADPLRAKTRRQLRLAAASFGDADAPILSRAARFVRRRTKTGWLAAIDNAAFPGGDPFRFEVEVTWDPVKPAGERVAASKLELRLKFAGGPTIDLATGAGAALNLEELLFAEGDSQSAKLEVARTLDFKTAQQLVSVLFGESFSTNGTRMCDSPSIVTDTGGSRPERALSPRCLERP